METNNREITKETANELFRLSQKNRKTHYYEADSDALYLPFPLIEVQEVYYFGGKSFFPLGDRSTCILIKINISNLNMVSEFILKHRINKALNRMIQAHETLRLKINSNDEQVIQESVPRYKMKSKKMKNSLGELDEMIVNEVNDYKTLKEHWPLFKVEWYKYNKHSAKLVIILDSLMLDGSGMIRFITELSELIKNPNFQIQTSSFKFRDYIMARISNSKEGKYQLYLKSTENKIFPISSTPLVPLKSFLNQLSAEEKRYSIIEEVIMSPKEWEYFKKRCRKKEITEFTVFLTLYIEAIMPWIYQKKFNIGIINTYRPSYQKDIGNMIGNFNTFQNFTVQINKVSFEEFARENQEKLFSLLQNQIHSGFEEIKIQRNYLEKIDFIETPIFFNSTINIKRNINSTINGPKIVENYLPLFKAEEVNLYPTQVLLLPTLMLSDSGGIICKWGAVRGAFQNQATDKIFALFKDKVREFLKNEEYWERKLFLEVGTTNDFTGYSKKELTGNSRVYETFLENQDFPQKNVILKDTEIENSVLNTLLNLGKNIFLEVGEFYLQISSIQGGYRIFVKDDGLLITNEAGIESSEGVTGNLQLNNSCTELIARKVGNQVELMGKNNLFEHKIAAHNFSIRKIEYLISQSGKFKKVKYILPEEPDYKKKIIVLTEDNQATDNIMAQLSDFLFHTFPVIIIPDEIIITSLNGNEVTRSVISESADITEELLTIDKKVKKIWSEITDTDSQIILDESNFFELGGDSIGLIRLISGIEKIFNIQFPANKFLKQPTLLNCKNIISEEFRRV